MAIAAWEEREEPLINATRRVLNTYLSKDYVITNDSLENYNDLIDPKKHIQSIRRILELVKQKSIAMCKIFPTIFYGSTKVWYHNEISVLPLKSP